VKTVLPLLLLAASAYAEPIAGGGGATISAAAGELIYTAQPAPSGVNGQIVLRKLAADGGVFWDLRFGRGRGDEATALATTADGGVVVAGPYRGGCFAARWDGQGRSVWEVSPNGSGLCHPAGVVSDGEGSTYVLAAVKGAAGFDAMVWKLSRKGDVVWSYRHSSNESLYPQNLYLDPRGDRVRAYVLRKSGPEYVEEFFRLDSAGRKL